MIFDKIVDIIEQAEKDGADRLTLAKRIQEYYWDLYGKKDLIKKVTSMRLTHTQKQIAAEVGVSQSMVSKILNEKLL